MAQSVKSTAATSATKPINGWLVASTAIAAVLVILAIGGYLLGWTWTGFRGNTLWDWLQLLVLPVALTVSTLWFSSDSEWRTAWTVSLSIIAGILVILIFGGYRLGWTWTGFGGNTLWDWLKLLLLPIVLTAVTVRFSQGQGNAAKE